MKFFKKENKVHDSALIQRKSIVGMEPLDLAEIILDGLDCDKLPNARGDFGHFYRNPIVTNGINGTFIYLGKLLIEGTTDEIMFHRLGSIENVVTKIGKIDIYETLSESGVWDILFVDMYHPRRSNLVPKGYEFKEYDEQLGDSNSAIGTYHFCEKFPEDFSSLLIRTGNQRYKELDAIFKKMKDEEISMKRPEAHQKKLDALKSLIIK